MVNYFFDVSTRNLRVADKIDMLSLPMADFVRRTPENTAKSDGRTVVGEGTTVKGSISVSGELVVNGTVEGGDIEARELLVGGAGVISGKVKVVHAVVHGRILEHIETTGCLSVRKTGSIEGSATYQEVEIERGAQFSGSLHRHSEGEQSTLKRKAKTIGPNDGPQLVPGETQTDFTSRRDSLVKK